MAGFTVTKHIAASPAEVFERASDFAGAPRSIEAITAVELLTEGPVGVGTRFRETRRMFGREAVEEMEVTEFEPPRRYVLGCSNHGCRYRTELGFSERDGGTDVRMTFEAEPVTAFARIMTVLMKPLMKGLVKTCAKDLDDLGASIEH